MAPKAKKASLQREAGGKQRQYFRGSVAQIKEALRAEIEKPSFIRYPEEPDAKL